MDQFNTEAMKLGARGVTITVSSGDNGVAGDEDSCNDASDSSVGNWPVRECVLCAYVCAARGAFCCCGYNFDNSVLIFHS